MGVFGSSSVTPTQQTVNGLWVYEPFLIRLYLEDDRVSVHRSDVMYSSGYSFRKGAEDH